MHIIKENKLVSQLFNNKGHNFYFIHNSSGKWWLIPQKNMKTAMSIYQPSSIKAKLFKKYFPILSRTFLTRKLLGFKIFKLGLDYLLEKKLKSLFGLDNLQFSVFSGTPSSHQKITVQIHSGSEILGYCKFSDKIEVKKSFFNEQKILNFLNKNKIDQIPSCLFRGVLDEETEIFVQSTKKTKYSKTTSKWTYLHDDFLEQLHNKTKKELLFKNTDFYHSLKLLNQNLLFLKVKHRNLVKDLVSFFNDFFQDKKVCFSAYHSDFTPWNTVINKDKLFVFDFEYAKLSYPPFLDIFHFYTMVGIHEYKWSAKDIYLNYQNIVNPSKNIFQNQICSFCRIC